MQRSELVKLLELLQPALSTNNLVQVYTCYVFREKSIEAFNHDTNLAIIAKASLGTEPFATNGLTLLGLLQNSHAEETEFQVTEESLVVKTGKSTFKLPYMRKEEFIFEEPKGQWPVKMNIWEELLKGIEICLTTASTDQSKPAYLGVCFNVGKKGLTLFSTDGDAITRYKTPAECIGTGTYMLPNAFCDALLKICKETDSQQGELKLNDDWAMASLNNGFRLYGRMIANDKPLDYQQVMDKTLNGNQQFVPVPLGLSDALARARVVADPVTAKTVITVEAGKLRLVTDTHLGVVRDEMKIKGHADVEANIHASLICRSLTVCDQVSIHDNCTACKLNDTVLQVLSNIGD